MTNLKKYTSYEDETKNSVELNESSNFDANFTPNIILLRSYKFKNRLKVVTSGVTNSGLFYSFCFSDKLQNYSKAGQT